jgi:hypothetical protein
MLLNENEVVLNKFDKIKNEEIRQKVLINYYFKDWRKTQKKRKHFYILKDFAKQSKKEKIVD